MKVEQNDTVRQWLAGDNFGNKDKANPILILFSNDNVEYVEKIVKRIIAIGIERIARVDSAVKQRSISYKNFFEPYAEDFEFVEICSEVAEEGIHKLMSKNGTEEHSKIRQIISDLEASLATLKNTWIPKLEDKRAKKKKQNAVLIAVIVILHLLIYGGIYVLF